MKFEINDEFEVLEKKPYTGLTFGQHVVPIGFKFKLKDWPYSESMLEAAIRDERVKKISVKEEKAEAKEEKAEAKKAERKKTGIQRKIDSLTEKYAKADSESDEAKDIAEQIQKLEAELND